MTADTELRANTEIRDAFIAYGERNGWRYAEQVLVAHTRPDGSVPASRRAELLARLRSLRLPTGPGGSVPL